MLGGAVGGAFSGGEPGLAAGPFRLPDHSAHQEMVAIRAREGEARTHLLEQSIDVSAFTSRILVVFGAAVDLTKA